MTEKGWVSSLDGNEMREVGYYEVPAEIPNQNQQPRIIDPKWTPDGKHIDFLLKDTVYSIPAVSP